MADLTLVNLNMLCVRYIDRIEREVHLPLGPLYLASALEDAGFEVDFRDYQTCDRSDPFTDGAIAAFLAGGARVVMVSCMANLLPFTLLALARYKAEHPESFVVLGGVGAAGVEKAVLRLCPGLDAIGVGEGELAVVALMRALGTGRRETLASVPGLIWRDGDALVANPPPPRIEDLDRIRFPAYHLIDLRRYAGINLMSSRGCPFPCAFCSVAPIWGRRPFLRSAGSIVAEMCHLREHAGAELFLFQDEYFVSSPARVQELCRAMAAAGLDVKWKAFGRIDQTDVETMEAMAAAGCVEIRYGVESGSEQVLSRVTKGFDPQRAFEVLSAAVGIFPGVDAFYMWGFPFESMDDFHATLLHMISARAMGVRILPSLLSLLPQTALYRELRSSVRLEFCPELFPEYMLTGHEVCAEGRIEIRPEHRRIYELVSAHPDVFPGFFHVDVAGNVLPKYRLLQKFGFYGMAGRTERLGAEVECCGAHSPE